MKPVDIYLRVCRVGGREHLISPDEQERRARELARERNLSTGVVLTDLDESGGKWDRPGLQMALERVRAGESGGLIVAWLDRLSRDSEHALRLVRELAKAGGKVYAPDAPADWTSPEGELQAGIVFAFAQYVRSRARAGFERAKEQAIANGIPVQTRAPVGYRKSEDRRLGLDPIAAPIIREVFERRAAGAGPTELAKLLESHGVRTSQGAQTWSKQSVAQLLKNRVYLGELSYGKDRRVVNTEAHKAIVDVATWEAAQHPNGPRPRSPRGAGDYALTGILRCAACGYSMQGTRTSRRKRIYRCTRRHAGGLCPSPATVDADEVERVAESVFWQVVENRAAVSEADPSAELAELTAAADRSEARFRQAMTREMQDAAGDGWAAIVRDRREERDADGAALGRAQALHVRSQVLDTVTLREVWADAAPGERRELYAARFDALALERESGRLIAFELGTAPADLPRRAYRRDPGLRPLTGDGARVDGGRSSSSGESSVRGADAPRTRRKP